MATDKLAPVRNQILEKMDILSEYEKLGFRPHSKTPNEKGWINGSAMGREDKNPSAGINVGSGKDRGKYKDFAAKGETNFFFVALKVLGGTMGGIVARYASQFNVEIPKQKEDEFDVVKWNPHTARFFTKQYPKVTNESLIRFGCTKARWRKHLIKGNSQEVFLFPINNTKGVVGSVLMPALSEHLIIFKGEGKIEKRKKSILKGSGRGWLNKDAMERLLSPERTVQFVWKVEGVTDALTLDSIIPDELRDSHVVVTNSGGAHEQPDKALCAMLKGTTVFVVHDADHPGQEGAKKWIECLQGAGVACRNIDLGFEINSDHGKDLRDFIEGGKTFEDVWKLSEESEEFAPKDDGFKSIICFGRQMRDITKDACESLRKMNDPPSVFLRNGKPLQSIQLPDRTILETMDSSQIAEQLSRSANFVKETSEGLEDCDMPKWLPFHVLASPYKGLPEIVGIATAPMFSKDGVIQLKKGYCKDTLFYNDFDASNLAVSENPSESDILEARDFIKNEVLGDFKFVDDASLAAAFEFMIRPFVSLMFRNSPMTVIHAPQERTGKTLLASVISFPFLGRAPGMSSVPHDDDELRKKITGLLMTGEQVFVLDNLPEKSEIDYGSLSRLLTSEVWTDRLLGRNKSVSLPSKSCWIATGNNPKFASDLSKRCISCKLDSGLEEPSKRSDFKHREIMSWMQENRWEIMESVFTIVFGWIAAGKPRSNLVLGGFTAWAEVMGGILGVAGIHGLLDNSDDFYEETNEQNGEDAAFLNAWYSRSQFMETSIADLVHLVNEQNIMIDIIQSGNERSQQIRLGKHVARIVGKPRGGFKVAVVKQTRTAAKRYRLVEVTSSGGRAARSDDETVEG